MLLQIINYHFWGLIICGSSPGWSTLIISNLEEFKLLIFRFAQTRRVIVEL